MNTYERFITGVTCDTVDFLWSRNCEIEPEAVARVVVAHLFPELASQPDCFLQRVVELRRIVELLYLQGEPNALRETPLAS
jgi:hypothetical protein